MGRGLGVCGDEIAGGDHEGDGKREAGGYGLVALVNAEGRGEAQCSRESAST
jgi:hypothetical protein